MTTITRNVLGELNDDIISHGWLVQAIKLTNDGVHPSQTQIANVLSELLETGQVEIGLTQTKPDYVEFVAWNGTTKERVNRAMETLAAVSGADTEFAYWLCLRQNVDRFEDDDE